MKNKFNILNNVKINIDEYEKLKFDNNDELKAKMIKKIKSRKLRNTKKIAIASSVAVISIVSLFAINPEIVRAMPIIGKVIEVFDSSTFGSPVDKYIKYSQGVEISATDKDTTISVTDFIIDENMFMIGLIVESNILSGYEGKNERDFVNISADILINGKGVESVGQIARQIDDTTGAVILSGNIAELNIDDNVKVNIHIGGINQGKKEISGDWDLNFKGEKVGGSQIIGINKEYYIKGQKLVVEDLVTSPISNTLILGGIDDTENYTLQGTRFKVVDDKGNILRAKIVDSSVNNNTGEFKSKIQIENDLSETSYIELIPYWGMDTMHKEIDGIYPTLLTTTGKGERKKIVISRKPTKEELYNGYALDKVYHYINIDKGREFLSVDELIGYEIPVNNKDTVIIKDINVNDKKTKITMQVKGNYEQLSQLVLFDEDMNDTMGWEGYIGAVLEDEKEKIYSITLDKIDKSKKYKIAIPQTKDINLDSKDKIRIDINN
jgi:hypothetical protein